MSEVRHDRLSGATVILAPVRGDRPHSHIAAASVCPFCPGHESDTPPSVLELPQGASDAWFVRVFPNLFPIVGVPEAGSDRGVHEVIVETPRHDQELAQRAPEEVQLMLAAYRHRLKALLARPGIRYVSVFRNKGPAAGSSLEHPHSQVIALPYVPDAITRTVRRWRRHYRRTGRCLLCEELSAERDAGTRVIDEREGFVLYAPFAAPMPGEVIVAPLAHRASFAGETDAELAGVSRLILTAATQLHNAFDDPDFNLALQTWPKGLQPDHALHWYLRIIPRRAVLGGFELATGDYVSTLSPEEAAATYRNAG